MIKRVAIYCKESNQKTTEGVNRLVAEFLRRGIKIQLYRKPADTGNCAGGESPESYVNLEAVVEIPDLVLSVGGDGTFLETVLEVRDLGIPVAGVNTGRLGFLANIPDEEISHSIDLLCSGEFDIVERSMIEITRPAGLFGTPTATALNEVTIQKADPRMITINVYEGGVYLNTYWADGLIVSTATGSTAYNLSVGGPILSPEDESIIISPLSPHNLTIRPIILSGNKSLKMIMEGRSSEFLATCDFRSRRLPFRDEVHISRSREKLKTVMLRGYDFYSTLRNKLMWGADRRN